MTSSFTMLALAPGALNTTMPFSLISLTGMLFTPAPARPIPGGGHFHAVHLGGAHQDGVRVLDLGGDLVLVARQTVQANGRDIVCSARILYIEQLRFMA